MARQAPLLRPRGRAYAPDPDISGSAVLQGEHVAGHLGKATRRFLTVLPTVRMSARGWGSLDDPMQRMNNFGV
jgi:hypothetical protein